MSWQKKLERYHLANRDSGGELRLGMLADLPDRDSPMGAEGRSWVREARKEVDRLNRKYGGGFYLFFREPRYSARDGRWMGWGTEAGRAGGAGAAAEGPPQRAGGALRRPGGPWRTPAMSSLWTAIPA